MSIIIRNSPSGRAYGPLQPPFSFNLEEGYTVLVGKNDSGKSAILQMLFKSLVRDVGEVGPNKAALLLPERIFIEEVMETGGNTLQGFNSDLAHNMQSSPLSYNAWGLPSRNELPRLLLSATDLMSQLSELDAYLVRLGFPSLKLGPRQSINLESVLITLHGTGLRSVYPILAALTNPNLKYLFIDEPELSLEPQLQRSLRELFLERSNKLNIVVATHSYLFLNKETIQMNYVVEKDTLKGVTSVNAVSISNDLQLSGITFDLLGASLEDLHFPSSFIVVEGSSDQVIVEKVMELKNIPSGKIKVISASSIENVRNIHKVIVDLLRPLIPADSPYAGRIGVLVDKPQRGQAALVKEMKDVIGDNLVILPETSLEEYLKDDFYTKSGRSKEEDLENLKIIKDDFYEVCLRKEEISNTIAESLSVEDLEQIPEIVSLVEKAEQF